MQNSNQKGYLILSIIVLSSLVLSLMYIFFNLTKNDIYISKKQNSLITTKNNFINDENTILKYRAKLNSDGELIDEKTCSGGLITYYDLSVPDCSGEWILEPNFINDIGNNDDYKATFYDETLDIENLLSSGSRLYDNDDYYRKNIVGFIPPLGEKTVFFMNSQTIELIDNNIFNTGTYINTKTPNNIESLILNFELSHNNGSIRTYKVDKDFYNQTKNTLLLNTKKGDILSNSGILLDNGNIDNSLPAYNLDIHNFDYYIVLQNNSLKEVLTYKINSKSQIGDNVYITPIDDCDIYGDCLSPEILKYEINNNQEIILIK